jgi:hypothetical protein
MTLRGNSDQAQIAFGWGDRRPLLLPSLAIALLAVGALGYHPSRYFLTLRVAAVCWSVLSATHFMRLLAPSLRRGLALWAWLLGFLAVGCLWCPYNYTFARSTWAVLDLALAAFAVVVGFVVTPGDGYRRPKDRRAWSGTAVTALVLVLVVPAMIYLVHVKDEQSWCARHANSARCIAVPDDDF